MSSNRRRSGKGRSKQPPAPAKQIDFWKAQGPLPDAGTIRLADDASATLRSLGPPPLMGQADAQKHIVLVAARAAGVATALAAAADILELDEPT